MFLVWDGTVRSGMVCMLIYANVLSCMVLYGMICTGGVMQGMMPRCAAPCGPWPTGAAAEVRGEGNSGALHRPRVR